MFARTTISRNTTRCLRSTNSRGLASAVQNPWHYETSESQGVKVATRDDGGPTANLAIVVKAGSRYEPAPGLAHALSNFAFKVYHDLEDWKLVAEIERWRRRRWWGWKDWRYGGLTKRSIVRTHPHGPPSVCNESRNCSVLSSARRSRRRMLS